jgi:hypothetical protein
MSAKRKTTSKLTQTRKRAKFVDLDYDFESEEDWARTDEILLENTCHPEIILWVRAKEIFDCTIYDLIPWELDVDISLNHNIYTREGEIVNSNWSASFCNMLLRVILCPLFKDNIQFLHNAIRLAMYWRLGNQRDDRVPGRFTRDASPEIRSYFERFHGSSSYFNKPRTIQYGVSYRDLEVIEHSWDEYVKDSDDEHLSLQQLLQAYETRRSGMASRSREKVLEEKKRLLIEKKETRNGGPLGRGETRGSSSNTGVANEAGSYGRRNNTHGFSRNSRIEGSSGQSSTANEAGPSRQRSTAREAESNEQRSIANEAGSSEQRGRIQGSRKSRNEKQRRQRIRSRSSSSTENEGAPSRHQSRTQISSTNANEGPSRQKSKSQSSSSTVNEGAPSRQQGRTQTFSSSSSENEDEPMRRRRRSPTFFSNNVTNVTGSMNDPFDSDYMPEQMAGDEMADVEMADEEMADEEMTDEEMEFNQPALSPELDIPAARKFVVPSSQTPEPVQKPQSVMVNGPELGGVSDVVGNSAPPSVLPNTSLVPHSAPAPAATGRTISRTPRAASPLTGPLLSRRQPTIAHISQKSSEPATTNTASLSVPHLEASGAQEATGELSLRTPVPPLTHKSQEKLRQCLGLPSVAALKRALNHRNFTTPFNELYDKAIKPDRAEIKARQAPTLQQVQEQLAEGESHGQCKYSGGAELNGPGWQDDWMGLDHYAYCLWRLRRFEITLRDGLFFQKQMETADTDSRIWQMILRARMDRRKPGDPSRSQLPVTVPKEYSASSLKRSAGEGLLGPKHESSKRITHVEVIDLCNSDEEVVSKLKSSPKSSKQGVSVDGTNESKSPAPNEQLHRKWKGKGKQVDTVDQGVYLREQRKNMGEGSGSNNEPAGKGMKDEHA